MTLDSILWTKLSVCGYSFTGKVYFILNSWFLTILNQMQLVSGLCKTFSCILTVDLDLSMNSLTLHIIFEVENMKCNEIYLKSVSHLTS